MSLGYIKLETLVYLSEPMESAVGEDCGIHERIVLEMHSGGLYRGFKGVGMDESSRKWYSRDQRNSTGAEALYCEWSTLGLIPDTTYVPPRTVRSDP